MAAKNKTVYICSECGYESLRLYGKCPGCGAWNTLEEQLEPAVVPAARTSAAPAVLRTQAVTQMSRIDTDEEVRYRTGLNELDRVLGGGLVKGSVVLLGGDPGIGKSTILMQICRNLGNSMKILSVSGEESRRQLKLRAERIGADGERVYVLTETDVEQVTEHIRAEKPDMVIIDSIQTMNLRQMASSPGSVPQVRECTNLIMRTAKELDVPTFIVSHVNKDGAIAGPKVLEHIVDAVLYFEGDKQMSYRILRAIKNRYGSTNEIGVFEMRDRGLCEVENPSMMLLSGRPKNVSGTCVACVMEGSRPILSEVQGLATPTGFGNPRRMTTGFDHNRMNLLLAVLEKRAGYFFSNMDAYINVIGGLRLDEPAADLAIAVALVSSLKDFAVPEGVAAFGEIGLSGEVRAVSQAEQRINELARLGFTKCLLPYHCLRGLPDGCRADIELVGVRTVREAIDALT
ncbi:MAG: DNA repair protein RadA [Clostridia bacterium]|nr:DNA repair protein RadA [Clostridia bacterium]